MIVLLLILVSIYFVVYKSSRPDSGLVATHRRVILVSFALTVCMFGYSYYQSNKPPMVNYYKTGWLWLIQNLNTNYQGLGNPNRIPEPGK